MTTPATDFWTPRRLAAITHGQWLDAPTDDFLDRPVPGLSIDTRTLATNQAYLALKGENHDGHDFIEQAFSYGASLAIVSHPSAIRHPPSAILQVPDTLQALQALAAAYRDVLFDHQCKVIAVAGSNGKTTTRHLIHHVLTAGDLTGTQSPKSFNNHIGVPLTLLAASPEHDFVAAEIGTNHPGEVAALARIARPDLAVITCIGTEHLEAFGDLEGVAREEYSLLDHLAPDGLAFSPRDVIEPYPGELPLPGEHNRMNAAYAEAIGIEMGVDEVRIAEALAEATPPPGRLNVLKLDGNVTLIDDTYNANPDSMRAALAVLAQTTATRRIAVLGDMFELGDAAPDGHQQVKSTADQTADAVVLVGSNFGAQDWSDDLPRRVAAMVNPGDAVLLKASRGMRLERIIPAITERYPPKQPG